MTNCLDYCHDCGNSAWMFQVGGVRVCTNCYNRRERMAKTADPTRLVTPEHHVTVDDFLAVGLQVEMAFTANVEPQQGVLLDHNHLGVLIARQPTEVLFYPWSAIRRLSEAK